MDTLKRGDEVNVLRALVEKLTGIPRPESRVFPKGTRRVVANVNTLLAIWGFPQDAPYFIVQAVAKMVEEGRRSRDHAANEQHLLTALHSACEEILRLHTNAPVPSGAVMQASAAGHNFGDGPM